MSIVENKNIARRFIQVWGRGDLSLVDMLAAPSILVRYPGFPQGVQSSLMFKKLLAAFRAAFPDSELQIMEDIAEGDKVVVRWSFTGTHRGNILGVPPSNKKVKWTGITIYKIRDGKVIEEIGEEDFLSFLRQVGVLSMAQTK